VLAEFQAIGEDPKKFAAFVTRRKRFVVHADEVLAAFIELESAIRDCGDSP
jgi:hypothetical protein